MGDLFVKKYLIFGLLFLAPTLAYSADSCPANQALPKLKNRSLDSDLRAQAGICLVQNHLGQSEVARSVLRIISDAKEDLFLREDLIEALGSASIRKTVSVEGNLAPKLGAEEKAALDRTIASASNLLAVTESVKSMDETMPVTRFENEFFRALIDIAQADVNHVLLRATAVKALEKLSQRAVESGVYEPRTLQLMQEAMRTLAVRDDNGSFYSGAASTYERLASANLPGFSPLAVDARPPARNLSSVRAQ